MAMLPKATYKFCTNPIKIPTQLFTDCNRAILNFFWKNKKPRIAKIILHNKGTCRDIILPDINFYFTAMIIIIIKLGRPEWA